ncbi:MAG: hypothetical protein IKM73_10190, partial [Acidaminococcaceae bacterium]|nr:hypothetical protein [Acidaminococcaceae bacterium]
ARRRPRPWSWPGWFCSCAAAARLPWRRGCGCCSRRENAPWRRPWREDKPPGASSASTLAGKDVGRFRLGQGAGCGKMPRRINNHR